MAEIELIKRETEESINSSYLRRKREICERNEEKGASSRMVLPVRKVIRLWKDGEGNEQGHICACGAGHLQVENKAPVVSKVHGWLYLSSLFVCALVCANASPDSSRFFNAKQTAWLIPLFSHSQIRIALFFRFCIAISAGETYILELDWKSSLLFHEKIENACLHWYQIW